MDPPAHSQEPPAPTPRAVVERFLGATPALSIEPLGAGLINTTYRVDSAEGRYVLQRINDRVFPEPERIVANLARLHALLEAHPEADVRLPRLRAPQGCQPFVRDAIGQVWRMMAYIGPSRTLQAVETSGQAAQIGRTLGRFHRLAAALDPAELDIVLPGFHDTPGYLAQLDDLLGARQPPAGVAALIDFIDKRRAASRTLADALEQGRTRLRVTHGDPKLDNLLFAPDGDRALCLIDLDTVQPGLIHHDIGDCLRSCCLRHAQSAGIAGVGFDLDICAQILRGYADEAAALMMPAEVELIYPAVRLIPFELGIRFLIDHLQGDRYFRVRWRGENLDKARVQLALVGEIERNEGAITNLVAESFARRAAR